MPIPKDKLDSIFSDPQFRSLPNERKDALLSKIESSYRGSQPRQPEMLPVEKPSLMKEMGKANTQLTNAIRQPLIGSDGGKPRSFVDKYSTGVAGLIDQSPLRNHPNLGALAYGAAAPFTGVAGIAADSVTNPFEVASGVGLGGLMKLIAPAEIKATEAIGKAIGNTVKNNSISGNIKNVVKPEKFATEVRGEMFSLRSKLGKELDNKITNLSATNSDKTINLSNEFSTINQAIANTADNPGLSSDIQRTLKSIKDPDLSKLIKSLIDDPKSASRLTLRQSEDIKKAISNSPVLAAKNRMGKFANWTSGDLELLDLSSSIRGSQAEVFDELSALRKPYAEFMQNYNVIKNKFKPGQLIKNLKTKFSDEELNAIAQKVLPPETWKKITGFRRTGKVAKAAGATAVGATGLAGLERLTR